MIARCNFALFVGVLLAADLPAQPSVKPRTDALGDPLPAGAIARLGTLRFKHTPARNTPIETAIYSPDGTMVCSLASGTGSIRLWRVGSGQEISGRWANENVRHSAIAFSPDGTLLAAARNPGFRPNNLANGKGAQTIILYDIAGTGQVKNIRGPTQLVQALCFTDRGKTLVAAGDGTVRWWDVATGKEQRSWQPFAGEKPKNENNTSKTKTFSYCVISPDAKYIALQVDWRNDSNINNGRFMQRNVGMQVDKEAIGFGLAKGEMRWRSVGKGVPYARSHFAFSAKGDCVAIAVGSGKVELRDSVTGKLRAHPLESNYAELNLLGELALSSDGNTVALASADSHVQLWNAKDGTTRQFTARIALNGSNSTTSLSFSPHDTKLLVGVDADLQIYDVATLSEVRPSEGHRGWVEHLAFSPDGKRLLSGTAGREVSGGDYYLLNGAVYYLVRSGTSGGFPSPELAAWDVATWKRLQLTSARTPPWPNFGSAPLSQAVYVGKTGDDRFALYDMTSGKLLSRMRPSTKQRTPGVGLFSPGAKLYLQYAGNNQGDVSEQLYAVPSGKLVCQLPSVGTNRNRGGMLSQEPGDPSKNIAFSPDERLVAQFGRGDGRIHVFDAVTGKLRHSLGKKMELDEERQFDRNNYDVAFSVDGRFLTSWSTLDKIIRLWDVATGAELAQFAPDARTNSPGIYNGQNRLHLAWSPDGRMLAVADSKIHLWELASLSVRRELAGHKDGPIRALAFSPNGQLLASASADTTVLVWDMALADRPARADGARAEASLEKSWRALAEDDAERAFAAILDLTAAPKQTLAWISERIKPATPIDPKRVEKLIDDLNDKQFKTRQNATAELLQMGERVVPALDKALATKPALETHLRLQDTRKRLVSPVLRNDILRAFRAVEVLERIGTPQASQVLQALAGGASGALITTQARVALERLERPLRAVSSVSP